MQNSPASFRWGYREFFSRHLLQKCTNFNLVYLPCAPKYNLRPKYNLFVSPQKMYLKPNLFEDFLQFCFFKKISSKKLHCLVEKNRRRLRGEIKPMEAKKDFWINSSLLDYSDQDLSNKKHRAFYHTYVQSYLTVKLRT
jgi:hypothetical protein